MRVLLDECIDRRLAKEFPHHEVKTVPEMSWAGITNGELLKLAEGLFDVFITVDRNLPFQQNIASRNLAIVVLRARSNRYSDLKPFASEVLRVISRLKRGQVAIVPE